LRFDSRDARCTPLPRMDRVGRNETVNPAMGPGLMNSISRRSEAGIDRCVMTRPDDNAKREE
jgi:hypothetical protein